MRPSQFGGKQRRRRVVFDDNGWEVRCVVLWKDITNLEADARVGRSQKSRYRSTSCALRNVATPTVSDTCTSLLHRNLAVRE